MQILNRKSLTPTTSNHDLDIKLWELAAPSLNPALRNQSFCVVLLRPGEHVPLHSHYKAEEVYYVESGIGTLTIDGESCVVGPGDTCAILPGQKHKLNNHGNRDLVLICTSSPPFNESDIVVHQDPDI
jgi:mannose-6-phosphate isomerase-like protein (cupin superfamily)